MVFFPGEVGGTFVWFCLPTPLVQVGGGGGWAVSNLREFFKMGLRRLKA